MKAVVNLPKSELRPFHLCCAAGMKSSHEMKQTPAFKLMELYFDWMMGYMESGVAKEEHVPFRLEHIIDMLKMTLTGVAREKNITLNTELQFTSRFLLGNRMKVLVTLLYLIHQLIEESDQTPITLFFDFDNEREVLEVKITAAEANSFDTIDTPFKVPVKSVDDKLLAEFGCHVIDYRSEKKQTNELSEAEFPYLFNISGGDQAIAQDIFDTILDSIKPETDRLQSAFDYGDWEELERLTHKLKPNFASVERKDISELLQAMEQLAIQKNKLEFSEKLEIFLSTATEALQELTKYE